MRRTDRNEWLESLLKTELGEATAPDGLWERIQSQRLFSESALSRSEIAGCIPRRTPRSDWTPLVVLAGAVLLAAAVWSVVLGRTTTDPTSLALEALGRAPENLDLRAHTVAEIRRWTRSNTGLDIPLPAATSRIIELTGACALKCDRPAVEVAYRVGLRHAALVVSKAASNVPTDGRHRFLKCEVVRGTRVSSWTMRGQLYTLAYAGAGDIRMGTLKDECLLCHDTGEKPAL